MTNSPYDDLENTNRSNDDLPYSISDKTALVKIRLGPGQAGISSRTVVNIFDDVVGKFGDEPALHQKVPVEGTPIEDTPWTSWTWHEYRRNCDGFAKSLISLRFERHDIINIIGFNSPEWFFADLGAILAGGIAAGIYATNAKDSCKYITQHSKAKVVVCDGFHQLEKYYEIESQLPELKALVVYAVLDIPEDIQDKVSTPVYTFRDFLTLGNHVKDEELVQRGMDIRPNEVCTLIYTSGTTGPPKAAMITHDNLYWTGKTMVKNFKRPVGYGDHVISYLPLSHVAAQLSDIHTPMQQGAQIWFAQPDALRGSLRHTLKEVRPTFFFGVPRVYEKIYDKMQVIGKSTKGMAKLIATWAKRKALAYHESHQYGESMETPLFYTLAQKILRKARVALGLDRCQVCIVSAAPIEVKILKYFASLDIPVLECYGASECTGPHTMSDWNAYRFGSVGRPLSGSQTRVDTKTGELLINGRHICAGYMDMEGKTRETIDDDGFLHTGDIGKVDERHQEELNKPSGFLRITGRLKEIIITAGGENIPPVIIEEQMKDAMPALSNCMVVGDKRKFLSMLCCLHVEIDDDNGLPTNKLSDKALDTSIGIGSNAKTTDEAKRCPEWTKYLDEGIELANSKATSHAQRVAKWFLLSSTFTEKSGELTPTLKLKRNVTLDIYSDIIEGIYANT